MFFKVKNKNRQTVINRKKNLSTLQDQSLQNLRTEKT